MSKKDKNNDPFFREDENGNQVFYPWAFPGEGFLLNSKQMLIIALIGVFSSFFVCLTVAFLILSGGWNFLSVHTTDYIAGAIGGLIPVIYILSMYWLKIVSQPYLVSSEKRKKKSPMQMAFLICPILFQIWAINSAINDPTISRYTSALIICVSVIFAIFLLWLFITITRRKGYFFYK